MICADLPDPNVDSAFEAASLLEVANQTTARRIVGLGNGRREQKIDTSFKLQERSGSSLECPRGSRARYRRSALDRGYAYTAAGDQNFPATLILPQVAPSDAAWVTLQHAAGQSIETGGTTHQNQLTGTYSKTITEQLGIQLQDGFNWFDLGKSSASGFQNLGVTVNIR
jgi:hypothetical protein